MRVNCCGNLDGEPRDMRKWERDGNYKLRGMGTGTGAFTTGTGTGTGGNYVAMTGAGTGGSLTQSGWEKTGAKNIVARDGYESAGIDFTTDSRPVPVPSRPPREFPSRFYP